MRLKEETYFTTDVEDNYLGAQIDLEWNGKITLRMEDAVSVLVRHMTFDETNRLYRSLEKLLLDKQQP